MTLLIQKYLHENGYDPSKLSEIGIDNHVESKAGIDFLHLDYSIFADKTNNMIKECRGLVLRLPDFNIARIGFRRFMNWGEIGSDTFDFSRNHDIRLEEKVDGSIILLHFIPEIGWNAGTRGRVFPDQKLAGSQMNFSDLFWLIYDSKKLPKEQDICYIFEIVSPLNQVVIRYEKPELILLGAVNIKSAVEYDSITLDSWAKDFGVRRPKIYSFTSIDILLHEAERVRDVLDEEGWVMVQRYQENDQYCSYHRAKIKRAEYLAIHQITSVRSLRNLISLVLHKCDDIIAKYPEYQESYNLIWRAIHSFAQDAWAVFDQNKHLLDGTREGRKNFAIKIKDLSFKHICFDLANNRWKNPEEWMEAQDSKSAIKSLIGILKLDHCVGPGWIVVEDEK